MADQQNFDEESFIILGTSPGTSLDIKCNGDMGYLKANNSDGVKCNGVENGCLDKAQIEDAMKDLSLEGSMALKASFKLGDSPSPASMMVASTIITDDKSTEELQKHFGELLDENVVLKETLQQNNDSMKEQFMLIASCQEDMMKTHTLHKEKFEETRELVERLRQENKKLKHDIASLLDVNNTSSTVNVETGEAKSDPVQTKSGPSSALEFVTSPDDETIDRLTAQLELVEKQRRQVITENEKLTWQKESLEHIVDATSKERDDLKEKLKNAECLLSSRVAELTAEVDCMRNAKEDVEKQLQCMNFGPEIEKRDAYIQQCNDKISRLHNDLKIANLKILELENVKLDFSKYKSEMSEVVRAHRETIHQLTNKLKETSTATEFQPVRMSSLPDTEMSPEFGTLTSHVKLYDRTLKHLAALLNKVTTGLSDNLVESIVLILSLNELAVEKTTVDNFRTGLDSVKQHIEVQQNEALANVGQIRGALSIFDGIFNDYKDVVKKLSMAKQETKPTPNMEQLSSALIARGHELQALEEELRALKNQKEDTEILKTQLDLYKSDFEAERDSRSKMASEKDSLATDLRKTKKLYEELKQQLEEVRRINPSVYTRATSAGARPAAGPTRAAPATPASASTGNMMYTCPKCMRFSCEQYKVMEDHFDFCLDDF